MCGRYTITVSIEELMLRYYTQDVTIIHYAPKYNAAPGQMIPAVIGSGHGNRIGSLRWGLIPSWSDRFHTGKPLINVRADTLGAKPDYRRLLSSRRCLIPADGFYEWRTTPSGKQPMRILMNDGGVFSLAGIYDLWLDDNGEKQAACAVITTEPNRLMQEIHHRMPVILRPEDEAAWLDRDNRSADNLVQMLRPYDAGRMRAYAVSPKVGNVRNDTKDLLEEA